jgi:hypothetical protein
VTVLLDACRAIDLGGSLEGALTRMRQADVAFGMSSQLERA